QTCALPICRLTLALSDFSPAMSGPFVCKEADRGQGWILRRDWGGGVAVGVHRQERAWNPGSGGVRARPEEDLVWLHRCDRERGARPVRALLRHLRDECA